MRSELAEPVPEIEPVAECNIGVPIGVEVPRYQGIDEGSRVGERGRSRELSCAISEEEDRLESSPRYQIEVAVLVEVRYGETVCIASGQEVGSHDSRSSEEELHDRGTVRKADTARSCQVDVSIFIEVSFDDVGPPRRTFRCGDRLCGEGDLAENRFSRGERRGGEKRRHDGEGAQERVPVRWTACVSKTPHGRHPVSIRVLQYADIGCGEIIQEQ